jgi:hypothetical protein
MRRKPGFGPLFVCALFGSLIVPSLAQAQSWEVRREIREGVRDVAREKREAVRELKRCNTRACAAREIREGRREVAQDRREARREIRREVREDYVDSYYRGNNRWFRDGRYWDRGDYERRYYYRRDDDDSGDVLKGALVGAAVVGVIAAIADSNED